LTKKKPTSEAKNKPKAEKTGKPEKKVGASACSTNLFIERNKK